MTANAPSPTRIDGKYDVLRELSREGDVTLSEVRAAEGVTRTVAWFTITSPAGRHVFHTYRAVLRALNPAGLTDVVARPGAYYTVWQALAGTPLGAFVGQSVKPAEAVDALRTLAARLAEHGYALPDADIVVDGHDARIAYLRALDTPRPPEEVAALNAPVLTALDGGRVRRRRTPGAWLAFVPGVLFLAGAGYLGAQAAQTYLNPPVREVVDVTGQEAQAAARKLSALGFRVEYTQGQAGGRAIGSVIRQEPASGTNLPLGRLVTLTVNNPPATDVPRLEEMNLSQAKDALKDRAMVLGKVVKVDGTLTNTPEGRIVAQLPEPGSAAQRGQQVQVMVSTGVAGKETWLPLLTGLTVEQAKQHARAAGLVVTQVKEQPSEKVQGTVLAQTPAAFVRVAAGSPVVLTVAVARYSAPSSPTDSLPLPPVYVPPTPVQPEPAQPEAPETTPDTTTPDGTASTDGTSPTDGTATPVTPETIPATPGTSTPDTTSPETTTPDTAATAARNVTFRYTFPANLPDGSYSVIVRDADGEREIMPAADAGALRGLAATSASTAVSGDAVFVIRKDGVDYATVTP
ncbi:beta-lactam-binding protein with PASTA domain [Deinococcus metalli]|uniref:Beta-lactam-binding protein with PASTA domain n=1 Tax=Deinococcus metalli TaxID=1141878 RepID=A0A7W8NLN7_9DEIO|nr:PASTA domain-containing protein [Deinococcus metalli]MBB5374899.1 beta-lactam-binding protein with PASTA domain [Deinococcus metalli]GHF32881.1 PASTA domain-containing protein [Deinococcus metalli]